MELSELLPGLFPASFRGVEFYMPDSRHEIGRRVQRFMFPGRDTTVDEDMGALDGPIRITGMLLGDDYIAQSRMLERALRAEGPGLLVHPWLGDLAVSLAGAATITFDDRKMRVVGFEASFLIWEEREFPQQDTLGLLLDAAAGLRAEIRAMLRLALAPAAMPLAAISAIRSWSVGAVATWRAILAAGPAISALAQSTGAAIAGLSALANIPVRTTLADEVSAAVQGVPRAIAARATVAPAAAIGAVDPAAVVTPDPAIAAALLLDAAALFARPAGPASLPALAPLPALALSARLAALADAAETAAAIAFDSAPDARAWQARMDAAIAAAAADAATLAATLPLGAGPLWRAASDLRRAVAADMAVRIGRLPEVLELAVPAPSAAWIIAQHIAGDTPAAVQAAMQDLLRRNRIRTPGLVPPGPVEILRPALAAWRVVDGPRPIEPPAAGIGVLDAFVLDVDRLG